MKLIGFTVFAGFLSLGKASGSAQEYGLFSALTDDQRKGFEPTLPRLVVSAFEDEQDKNYKPVQREKRPILSAIEPLGKRTCDHRDDTKINNENLLQTPPRPTVMRSEFSPMTQENLRSLGVSPRKLLAATNEALLSPDKRGPDAPPIYAIRGQNARARIMSFEAVPFDLLMFATQARRTRDNTPATLPIAGKKIPVVDLHPSVEHPEELYETQDQTLTRRIRQRDLLEKVRLERTSIVASSCKGALPSHVREQHIMADFVNYLSVRRAQFESLGRMRRAEVEEIFQAVVSPVYHMFQCEGYTVWYNPAFIALDAEIEGRTNRERMEDGLSPIGSDGSSMNLHHVTHYDALTHKTSSHLVLLHAITHLETYHNELHFESHEFYLPRTPVERRLFDPVRSYLLMEMVKRLSPKGNAEGIPLEFPLLTFDDPCLS